VADETTEAAAVAEPANDALPTEVAANTASREVVRAATTNSTNATVAEPMVAPPDAARV
jgi:hypothetical protein